MPFRTAGTFASGDHDAVCILSDFEPDDVVAIKLLAPRLRGVPLLLVVGEGDVDKRELGAAILASYGLDKDLTVVQGKQSKLSYPTDALKAYSRSAHAATIAPLTQDATAAIEAFLAAAGFPFALVLKPPHELTGVSAASRAKTVCAMYGSFNLVCYRDCLGAPDEAAAWAQQEALLASFKSCLLVERSTSVGRDATVDSGSADVWPWLQRDAPLMSTLEAWNRTTLVNHAKKIVRFGEEVERAFGGGDGGGAATFSSIASGLSGVEKKLAIFRSIVDFDGQQCCLADPLVAVGVADVAGLLSPYVMRCRVGHSGGDASKGAGIKLTLTEDETSPVWVMRTSGAAQQEEMVQQVRRALVALSKEDAA